MVKRMTVGKDGFVVEVKPVTVKKSKEFDYTWFCLEQEAAHQRSLALKEERAKEEQLTKELRESRANLVQFHNDVWNSKFRKPKERKALLDEIAMEIVLIDEILLGGE